MSRQHSPGLCKRGEVWHIDKRIKGYGRLAESTGERTLEGAEARLAERLAEIKAGLSGARVERTFAEAAARYLTKLADERKDVERPANALNPVMTFVGHLSLRQVHAGTLRIPVCQR